MRGLSHNFIEELKSGFLYGISQKLREDKDLDLQIRENYFNIYYKGNSLLRLRETQNKRYRITIHDKFKGSLNIPNYLQNKEITENFLSNIPFLKENIIKVGFSLEVEYEQMIIRANNYEPKINSEYFIVDRQYSGDKQNRFDLTGFFWDRNKRNNRREVQNVPLCFMEVKYGLNPDISNVHKQIAGYHKIIEENTAYIAKEAEDIFKQKLELNLINYSKPKVLKSLSFSQGIKDYQFIIVLVDYNPNSELFKKPIQNLKQLSFANQIRIFQCGFAIWQQGLDFLGA